MQERAERLAARPATRWPGARATTDPATGGILLFGGNDHSNNVYGDTWRWQAGPGPASPPRDGEAWHLVREDAIPALIFPRMAWDARRQVAVLVGMAQAGDAEVQTRECRVPANALSGTGTGRSRGTEATGACDVNVPEPGTSSCPCPCH